MENIRRLDKYLYKPTDDKLKNTRDLRNKLLQRSDWTQGADSPLSQTKREQWATYRQALRDLNMTADPVVWPIEP